MNDIMSLGLHRIWKEEFINMIELQKEYYLLDLATGSGDLLELIKKSVIAYASVTILISR